MPDQIADYQNLPVLLGGFFKGSKFFHDACFFLESKGHAGK